MSSDTEVKVRLAAKWRAIVLGQEIDAVLDPIPRMAELPTVEAWLLRKAIEAGYDVESATIGPDGSVMYKMRVTKITIRLRRSSND